MAAGVTESAARPLAAELTPPTPRRRGRARPRGGPAGLAAPRLVCPGRHMRHRTGCARPQELLIRPVATAFSAADKPGGMA